VHAAILENNGSISVVSRVTGRVAPPEWPYSRSLSRSWRLLSSSWRF